ncbi:hypothetical protein, partial [Psychrobacter sp. Rd 27.2]
SEIGGSGNVGVKLMTKGSNATPVEAKAVTIQLDAKAKEYGITVAQGTTNTDFSGETTFAIKVPEGLTAVQRADLKSAGFKYQLSYVENNITYKSDIKTVKITTPSVSLNVLNATNN